MHALHERYIKTIIFLKEQSMLDFVMKAIKSSDAVEQQDIDQLHDLGWTDRDILDALVHGANMVGSSILMKTFKMGMLSVKKGRRVEKPRVQVEDMAILR
jgi:alkylhydroperoxidase family enzyme